MWGKDLPCAAEESGLDLTRGARQLILGLGATGGHHHAESTPVQDPRLILRQTEDLTGGKHSQVLAKGLEESPGKTQIDQRRLRPPD